MSTNREFYPSPPSTTSLPEHYSFPPLTGSDPPPTDGPNTRDRLKRGLLPRSGRVKVENNKLNQEEGEMFDDQSGRFEMEEIMGNTRNEGGGLHEWNGRSKVEMNEAELEPPYHHHQQDELSFSSSTSSIYIPDVYIDPILRTSTTSSSSLSNFAVPPPPTSSTIDHTGYLSRENDQEDVFGFYPPSFPPHTTLFDPSLTAAAPSPSFLQHHSRIVSNATIIEHEDSSFEGPSGGAGRVLNQSVGREGSLNKSTTSNGLGITREEWLRLGGFTEDEGDIEVTREEDQRVDDVFNSSSPSTNQFSNSTAPIFTLPPPPFPPSPPRSNSKLPSNFVLPTVPPPAPNFPPTPIESNWVPSPLVLPPTSFSTFTLPIPPPQFHTSDSRPSTATSTKSDRRSSPLKSPRKKTLQRPTPYPLNNSTTDTTDYSSSTPSVLLPFPPKSPNSLRNLTPVTSAVFHSAQTISIPTATTTTSPSSSSSGSPLKKSHSRKTSLGHIPRPRNAFILFRSHIVNTGRIPKTTLSKLLNPRTGIEEEVIKKVDHKNVSRIVGEIWRGLGEGEKKEWEKLAEMEKLEHREKYPDYKYKPKIRTVKRASAKTKTIEEAEGEGTTTTTTTPRRKSRKKHRELETEDDKDMKAEDLIVEENESLETTLPPPHPPQWYPLLNQAQPSFSPGDSLVSSPYSNDSSFSTAHHQSPQFYQNLTPTKIVNTPRRSIGGIDQTASSSPPVSISSNSPSPSRHYPPRIHHHPHPYTRTSVSPTKERHPLSRSQTSSSSVSHSASLFPPVDQATHQYPTQHFSQAHIGLGITFPPHPVDNYLSTNPQFDSSPNESNINSISNNNNKNNLDQIPLFTGSTNSRQFSLGRWELRKPSRSISISNTAVIQVGGIRGSQGLMERSLSAAEVEGEAGPDDSQEGGGTRGQQRISSALVLDPRQFLTDAGLFDNDDDRHHHELSEKKEEMKEEEREGERETFSVWGGDDTESVSTYSTAPTTISSSHWSRSGGLPLQPQQTSLYLQQQVGGGIGSKNSTELFHFGSTNLFSKPPSALVGRSSSGMFPNSGNSDVSQRGGIGSGENGNQQQK